MVLQVAADRAEELSTKITKMKILLVHPDDDPAKGPWADSRWDHVIDIGLGGLNAYQRWGAQFQCPVTPLGAFRRKFDDLRQVRELLGRGCGHLIDEHGLDWWEILSILLHREMEAIILVRHFAETLGSFDEVHVSRAGLHASLLQKLVTGRVRVFPPVGRKRPSRLRHYAQVWSRLSAPQMIDVLCDKYDPGYRFRGGWTRKRQSAQRPAVLFPTAYVNVSSTAMAYAGTFPEENFLMVATRRSGWLETVPPNVSCAWLSRYASRRDRSHENRCMWDRFSTLLNKLGQGEEFNFLNSFGSLDAFPQWLLHGFEVRDAWLNVLDIEPIQCVLCADDSNPYTRIPLMLAQSRGLPNIACHHGALDGRYVFKRIYGEAIWAKGRMEQDYLVRHCGVPAENVEIAAPALTEKSTAQDHPRNREFQPYLLFLSEATSDSGGRPEEFYRDLLPPLADLAAARGRTLIVKLHPAESERERKVLVERVLTPEQRKVTQVVSGPLTDDLLDQAWFGITILSTVAVECAIRGIPCFLCRWLECWPYGYVEQFIRFGVGIGLSHPDEITKIPQHLERFLASDAVRENCWQPAAVGRLRELLNAHGAVQVAAAG